jgi:serine/threonine-protein kinase
VARRELAVSIPDGEPTRLVSMPLAIGRGAVLAGTYQVERVLGVGGMGVVVAARHLQLQQRVALKFLLSEVAKDEETVQRFLREAQAASRIPGEHVARVLEVGTLSEIAAPYMVMELLEGRDLAALLVERGAPLPPAEAVDYVLQGMEAIAEAHALGIVHRDVKPSNLFLTHRPDGSPLVKVLDFGLSKEVALRKGQRALTKTSTSGMGSPLYMAPEQVRSAKSVTYAADVWSLGVTLYELLANDTPFHGDGVGALLASVVADAPRPLRAAAPSIPEGLEEAIMRCLEKDPARRHASVGALAAALAPYASPAGRTSVERVIGAIGRAGAAPGPSPGGRAAAGPAGDEARSLLGLARSARGLGGASSAVAILGLVALGALVALGSFLALRTSPLAEVERAAPSGAAPIPSAPPSASAEPAAREAPRTRRPHRRPTRERAPGEPRERERR